MRQIYKVNINDKQINFACSEYVVNNNDTTITFSNPSENITPKIISDFMLNKSLQKLFLITTEPKSLFNAFRKDYKIVEAAGGLVKDKDNRILFIFRRGKWDLPKGKIEKDERKQHAALREVIEETGLDTLKIVRRLDKTYHIYTEKNIHILKKTYWYEMVAIKAGPLHPQTEEDITDIRWFEPDNLNEVLSNTYPLVAELVKGIL